MRKRIRICAFKGCDKDISHLRQNAIYCCDAHRKSAKRSLERDALSVMNVVAPPKSPKEFMMPSHTPVQVCVREKCENPQRHHSVYCSDACKVMAYRQRNNLAGKSNTYDKARTSKEYKMVEVYTQAYKTLNSFEARVKMIRGALALASIPPNSPKYNDDIAALRRVLRSPHYAFGKGPAERLVKKHGDLFPMLVAGYVQAVFHYKMKVFFWNPDMTPACDESTWDEKPATDEDAVRQFDKDMDIETDADIVIDEEVVEPAPARRSIDAVIAEIEDDVRISRRNVIASDDEGDKEETLSDIIKDRGIDEINKLIDSRSKHASFNLNPAPAYYEERDLT